MLIGELIMVIVFVSIVVSQAESKGHKPALFVAVTFAAWMMGGFCGLLFGALVTGFHTVHTGLDFCFVYFSCFFGQVLGLGLALFLVVMIPKKQRPAEENYNERNRLRNSPDGLTAPPRRDRDANRPSSRQAFWQRRLPPDATEKFGERLKHPKDQEENDSQSQ
jgi:hypothetical protein